MFVLFSGWAICQPIRRRSGTKRPTSGGHVGSHAQLHWDQPGFNANSNGGAGRIWTHKTDPVRVLIQTDSATCDWFISTCKQWRVSLQDKRVHEGMRRFWFLNQFRCSEGTIETFSSDYRNKIGAMLGVSIALLWSSWQKSIQSWKNVWNQHGSSQDGFLLFETNQV